MNLKHLKFGIQKGSMHTANQLRALGVPAHEIKRTKDCRKPANGHRPRGFWDANEGREHVLLHLAREAYVKRIKEAHPDKGGDTETAKSLNVIWGKVERSFGKRGIVLN